MLRAMRRWLGAALAMTALLAGACGEDDGDEERARAEVEAEAEAKAQLDSETAAFCSARTNAEAAAPAGSTPTTSLTKANLREQFAKAKEGLDEMVEHAPGEIEADVKVFADAQKGYIEAFEKANFDFTKVDFNSPAFKRLSAAEVQQSSQRVTDYFKTKCGTG
jgi:hypothetical protein